jgi:hypothetical protein
MAKCLTGSIAPVHRQQTNKLKVPNGPKLKGRQQALYFKNISGKYYIVLTPTRRAIYRDADKSLARPGRKKATSMSKSS